MATEATFAFLQGVTFTRDFSYYTPGTPNVPIDLTGQSLIFEIRDSDQFVKFSISSADGANANGSILEITDADGGLFSLTVTDEDTHRLKFDTGFWWLGLNNAGAVRRIGHGDLTSAKP